jgi:Flp pilus assembly protein TadG
MTAFMLTALIGAAALAVDFGQMYRYRAQLQATADATALAPVVSLANGAKTASVDSAVRYSTLNLVGSSETTVASTDVLPGTWDGARRVFRHRL